MKRLIVTGDDFGASTLVNEAIEQAHRAGILSTTSLMVGGRALDDALRRARQLPSLRVGLHVVLVDGEPVLDPHAVPALVDANGNFSTQLVRSGFNFYFNGAARRQLRAEIQAQFEAYRATGLSLDHVNGHNHMHIHPTVLATIIDVGRDFGIKSVRVPYEPLGPSWRANHTNFGGRFGNSVLLWPMVSLMRARIRSAGLFCNDYAFGVTDSGHMTKERVAAFLRELPEGVTEMYMHPATSRWPGMPAYAQCQDELAALVDPDIVDYVRTSNIVASTYSDLASAA